MEYLWCGLPVIYHDYAELSDYIRDYKAGWIVDPDDRTAIAAVINDIFDHPEQVAERSQNAQRLVRELLSWDETIGPLDVAIRHPSVRPGASQARAEASGPRRSRGADGAASNWRGAVPLPARGHTHTGRGEPSICASATVVVVGQVTLIKKVLVVSGDALPLPGYPTSGAGLRAWGIGQGLRSHAGSR